MTEMTEETKNYTTDIVNFAAFVWASGNKLIGAAWQTKPIVASLRLRR